jgi:hypothetical protein
MSENVVAMLRTTEDAELRYLRATRLFLHVGREEFGGKRRGKRYQLPFFGRWVKAPVSGAGGGYVYSPHPSVKSPPDGTKIWRFIDLSKYISLLSTRTLFFSKPENLQDPYECLPPKRNLESIAFDQDGSPRFGSKENVQKALQMSKDDRAEVVINCWHMNEHESAAMWKLYLKSEEGVAIESTFSRFREGLLPDGDGQTYIGEVQYVDYRTARVPVGNLFYTFLHKRLSFEHERELRAFRWSHEYKDVKWGVHIPVSPETLIERVRVSPTSGEWFCQVVKSITEKFGLDPHLVIQSDLYTIL